MVSETAEYTSIVKAQEQWPNCSWTAFTLSPACRALTAQLCLKS